MKQRRITCLVFFIAIFLCNNVSIAQSAIHVDSAFASIRERALELVSRNTDSAEIYANQLIQIAKISNADQLLADALSTLSLVKIYQSKPDEAFELNQQSFEINTKTKNAKELAKNNYRFGTLYNNKSDFINAAKYFLASIEVAQKEKMFPLIQKCYRNLSGINITQEKFNEALAYAQKAVETEKLSPGDNIDKAENLFALATCYKYLKNTDLAEENYQEAYRLYAKEDFQMKAADVLSDMAGLYTESDPIKSLKIGLEARRIFDAIGPELMPSINNLGNIGEGFFLLAQNDSLIKRVNTPEIPNTKEELLDEAEKYLIRSIQFSKKQDIQQAILYYSGVLSDVQAYKGDYKSAFDNLQFKFKYRDSLFSQENKNAIAKLESEKEMLQIRMVSEQKSTLNKILLGAALGIFLISLLGYRNFRNKQKVASQQYLIQQQKIVELEKDKQLFAVDAMLKGQEEERSRIAKDLHDGLGGMLSGVKLSFINMKENMVMSAEGVIAFENSILQLDATITELRKVAHNLMPEALVKFGLKNALLDYCNTTQLSSKVSVSYEQLGSERPLGNTADLNIYRIVQELISNAIKHGSPSKILVQLTKASNKVLLTVEDDGKGFDKTEIVSKVGMGITSVQQRVDYFTGSLDIDTAPGQGTSINIELYI